jgi:hypothetical protein
MGILSTPLIAAKKQQGILMLRTLAATKNSRMSSVSSDRNNTARLVDFRAGRSFGEPVRPEKADMFSRR